VDRRGRYEFFARQYEAYLPRVLNYVRLRVGDKVLAQDLTARTFERALTHIDSLRDLDAFGGWLFRIARNVIAGYYRRREPEIPLEWVTDQAAADPSPESDAERLDQLEMLQRVLAGLSEREREIIRLRFVAELPHREIGKAMGLRAGNVAVILYRALAKLREQFEQEGI
jgi:RNA polymerase sigma-70 factor (ECF subfamily)